MKKFLSIILILGAGIVIGFTTSSFVLQPASILNGALPEENHQEVIAHLMIDFRDGTILTCNNQRITGEETVFVLLEICSLKEGFSLEYQTYPELGVFITQIGEKTGDENGKYWQYWVNNEYAQVGASQFKLKNGDVVAWKFLQSQF